MEFIIVTEQENNCVEINDQVEAYTKQRQRANERKRKFLENMTPEQREQKKAKDREYNHQRRRAKKKSIKELNEKEKEGVRSMWRRNSKSYRDRQRAGPSCESSEQCDLNCEIQLPPACPDVNTDGLIVWEAAFDSDVTDPNLLFDYCFEPTPILSENFNWTG